MVTQSTIYDTSFWELHSSLSSALGDTQAYTFAAVRVCRGDCFLGRRRDREDVGGAGLCERNQAREPGFKSEMVVRVRGGRGDKVVVGKLRCK